MPRSKLPSLSSITDGSFEPSRKNPIMLGDDSQLGSELKPIKIGGKTSILELSETSLRISVDIHDIHTSKDFLIKTDGNLSFDARSGIFEFVGGGDALLTWNSAGTMTFVPILDKADSVEFNVTNGGNLKITTNDSVQDALGHILIEPDGHIGFTSQRQGYFYFSQESNYRSGGGTAFAANYLRIHVAEDTGATEFLTTDADAQVGHMTFKPDGNLILDPDSGKTLIAATDKLYFDGGGDTYISESSADNLRFEVGGQTLLQLTEAGGGVNDKVAIPATIGLYFDGGVDTYIYEQGADALRVMVGGDILMQLSEKGDDGNEVSFGSSCAGFTQIEPTYDATSTIVDFRHSNKQFVTFGSGNITNLQLIFPLVSGNFVCLIKQDGTGSRTITNYKAMEFDESSADGSSGVKFPGGSNPTLTTDANHVDILSFYWDADNEIAYGVATLDFQF